MTHTTLAVVTASPRRSCCERRSATAGRIHVIVPRYAGALQTYTQRQRQLINLSNNHQQNNVRTMKTSDKPTNNTTKSGTQPNSPIAFENAAKNHPLPGGMLARADTGRHVSTC